MVARSQELADEDATRHLWRARGGQDQRRRLRCGHHWIQALSQPYEYRASPGHIRLWFGTLQLASGRHARGQLHQNMKQIRTVFEDLDARVLLRALHVGDAGFDGEFVCRQS